MLIKDNVNNRLRTTVLWDIVTLVFIVTLVLITSHLVKDNIHRKRVIIVILHFLTFSENIQFGNE